MTGALKHILAIATALVSMFSSALTNCAWDEFYKKLQKVSDTKDVECGTWYGPDKKSAESCIQKAKDTGYLMFWFIFSRVNEYNVFDCEWFRKCAICRDSFVNVVNDYGYLILCASDYSNVYAIKNNIYGYVRGGKILDEATGTYVDNKNGYPKTVGDIGSICSDHPPSLHLLKFDQANNILFHVFTELGEYDTKFSPYATRFPIPSKMNKTYDAFAPWFKQYLDMFRAKEQIAEYEDAGGTSQSADSGLSGLTNIVRVDIAITETVHPTVYQIALHRDNVLFRAVTTMRDIMVKERIECNPTRFDDRCQAVSRTGSWFVNHDDTMTAISDQVMYGAKVDIIPSENCTFSINQRFGNGFVISEYDYVATTNIVKQNEVLETGVIIETIVTNVVMEASSTERLHRMCSRNEYVEHELEAGKLYSISVDENSTFDIFSTR